MAKTLRVRTRTGWVTKPVADEPENRLTAEEVDDNFLGLEDAIADAGGFEVGHTMLMTRKLSAPGWLDMTGLTYTKAAYPVLGELLGGIYAFDTIVSGTPTASPFDSLTRKAKFSPDGTLLAVAHLNNTITILSVPDWAVVQSIPSFGGLLNDIAWSPDGAMLCAVGDWADAVAIIDTDTWTQISTPNIDVVYDGDACAWSPDGLMLAIGTSQSICRVYDTSNFTDYDQVALGTNGVAEDLVFSHDGQLLAIACGNNTIANMVRVYETATWTLVHEELDAFADGYYDDGIAVAFSPDDAYLAYSKAFRAPWFRVLETSGWTLVGSVPTFSFAIRVLRFTGDGLYLLAGTQGDTQNFYVMESSDWSIVTGTQTFAQNFYDIHVDPSSTLAALSLNSGPSFAVLDLTSQTEFTVPSQTAPRADMVWRIKAEDV